MATIALELHHLGFSWPGGANLLDDQSHRIALDGVVALCGPNGSGKSTLLALLEGSLHPTSGWIRLGSDEVSRPAQRLEALEMSPGEAQRARLGTLLRDDGSLLLLDEPTNHLDAAGLGELEARLRRRRSPTILVSHDRDLLDRLARKTLWIEDGRLVETSGGFTSAWEARGERMREALTRREARDRTLDGMKSRLQALRETAQASERDRTAGRRMKDSNDRDQTSMAADFKFRNGQARSGGERGRLRDAIGRLEALDAPEVRRDTLRDIAFPWDESRAASRLSLPAGEVVAPDGTRIAHGGVALDGRTRLRLEGANGSGKSTLLRALAAPGRPGVFHLPQEPELLDDLRFLERIREAPREDLGRILSLAAALGASGEALRSTAAPSPGEARKLRLATALASRSWMLLLDEPTNHLDAASIQKLQEALELWPGGLVLATHDERLAQAVATRSWRLEGGRLRQS